MTDSERIAELEHKLATLVETVRLLQLNQQRLAGYLRMHLRRSKQPDVLQCSDERSDA